MAYSQQAIKNAWAPRCSPPWARVELYGGAQVTVDALIVQAVIAMNIISKAYNYRCSGYDNAGYGCRKVAGTRKWSKHAYGIAIDREFTKNPYSYRLITDRPAAMNRAIVSVRTNNGRQVWGWGGYWRKHDAMHDEIVCTPQDLATGVNWSTVAGYVPAKPAMPTKRQMAYTALKYVKEMPDLHPNDSFNWHVVWLQRGLNIARGLDLADDGKYGGRTVLAVADFQNDVRKFGVSVNDREGHAERFTRFYLAAALENIAKGIA